MKLHRVKHKADWELVNPADWNVFQRVAAASRGFATPGNVSTLAGFMLVALGVYLLYEEVYFYGFLYIATGRVLDLVDGAIAHKTGTKSHIGEAFDSIADKLAVLIVVVGYSMFNIMPFVYLALFLALQLITSISVGVIKRRGSNVHTPKIGKIASFLMWISVGFFSVVFMTGSENMYYALFLVAHVSFYIALAANVQSTQYYVRKALSE